jgi:hypothetical protein
MEVDRLSSNFGAVNTFSPKLLKERQSQKHQGIERALALSFDPEK